MCCGREECAVDAGTPAVLRWGRRPCMFSVRTLSCFADCSCSCLSVYLSVCLPVWLAASACRAPTTTMRV